MSNPASLTPGPDHAATPIVPDAPVKDAPTKAWVGLTIAAIGSGITSALGFVAVTDPTFVYLTIGSAVLTTLGVGFGVYQTTNSPKV